MGSGEREDETLWRGRVRRYGAPFPIPHSLLPIPRSPSDPGTVIALKVSHCIHIAFGSRVAPEAVWMVMV
jgi:hypothetical protein